MTNFEMKSGRFFVLFIQKRAISRGRSRFIWLKIAPLAKQLANDMGFGSLQSLDFQGLAGFSGWQFTWQSFRLKHAAHQLPSALQIRLLHMGVHVAHGRDI